MAVKKSFYHIKSVNSGLVNLLKLFCKEHDLNLPSHILNYTVDERISAAEWFLLLDYIEQQYPVSALGFKISKFIKPEHLGVLGYICLSCKDWEKVLNAYIKYQRLICDFVSIKVTYTDHECIVSWEFDAYIKAHTLSNEIMLAIFLNLSSQFVNPENFSINRIEFDRSTSESSQQYGRYFNAHMEFNCEQIKVFLPLSNLALTIPDHDIVLNHILDQQASCLLSKLPEYNSFDEIIEHAIICAINQGDVSIEYVAQQLGYTPRILQYKLKQRGSNFKQYLNEVRKNLAITYLNDPSLSILDVSLLLSYQEQTSFNRSFKIWTGLSPSQYRRKINLDSLDSNTENWNILI